jgi:hypothetical protein
MNSTCNKSHECTAPVTYVSDKGFIYCTSHSAQARTYGHRGIRKLHVWEIKAIAAGETISYIYRGKPVATTGI